MSVLRNAVLLACLGLPAAADPPVIQGAELNGNRLFVTVSHPDTGWDHYANGWEVRTPDGALVGTRPLAHPHVTEQPFTRSTTLGDLPAGLSHLVITATDTNGNVSAAYHLTLMP